jgi:hypothetical protein
LMRERVDDKVPFALGTKRQYLAIDSPAGKV